VPLPAGIETIAWQAPLAFLLGVAVGLGLASRFRIVKRPPPNEENDP